SAIWCCSALPAAVTEAVGSPRLLQCGGKRACFSYEQEGWSEHGAGKVQPPHVVLVGSSQHHALTWKDMAFLLTSARGRAV
ncbi:hypothetical protein CIB84_002135, partial [Bambusicola thoracicus]